MDSMCILRFSLIVPPATYIYAILFTLTAMIASVGNTISLFILWKPQMRTRSNKFLSSLVVSDVLVGYILMPLSALQMLDSNTLLKSCIFETIRALFIVSLIGTSACFVSLTSYDRYILLTKLKNYNRHMSNRKAWILIILSWFVPCVSACLRTINFYAYLVMLIILTIGPLIIMPICYALIAVEIKKTEKRIYAVHVSSLVNAASVKCFIKENISQQRQVKLAKTVSFIIFCYFICLMPAGLWFLLTIINKSKHITIMTERKFQNFNILTLLFASINSCINPIIYASKYPEFRSYLRKMIYPNKIETV